MTTECAIRHKKYCIAPLVLVLVNLAGLLQAQFVEVDIELPPRFEIRIISPEDLWAEHPDVEAMRMTLEDGILLPEALVWLEISSVENLELLMDTRGEYPVYYINAGVFDPEQAVPFTESTAFRLSTNGRPDAATRLFRAWIGIRSEEEGLIDINCN